MNTQAQPAEPIQPTRSDSSIPSIGIHITREEMRAKSLHELAEIFESAFKERA